ncbi:MAG: methylase, partial [Sphingomonadales bacterium]|nr:methylase [Sphingomonadales bacterium]
SLLGRIVPPEAVNTLLDKLGLGGQISLSPDELVQAAMAGNVVPIGAAAGLSLKRSRVNGERRLEILGFDPRALPALKAKGCFTEIIQYQTRLFVPVTGAGEILEKLAA